MAATAAHLVENEFPRVPVRQWVVTFPRRLRFFLHRDPVLLGRVRHVVLHTIEAALRRRCPDAPAVSTVQQRIRIRTLRVAVHHGALTSEVAADLARCGHGGGFSLHAAVRIEAQDRAGLERLLRYCAPPELEAAWVGTPGFAFDQSPPWDPITPPPDPGYPFAQTLT
jgi:hypothetical protein